MAIPTAKLDQILTTTRSCLRSAFRGWPMGAKNVFGRAARAVALSVWQAQGPVEVLDRNIVPSPQSSDDALTLWAQRLGWPDGQGGFGRLLPTAASGGTATLTGTKGATYPAGAIASAPDGTLIELSGSVTIAGSPPGTGSITGTFDALTAG